MVFERCSCHYCESMIVSAMRLLFCSVRQTIYYWRALIIENPAYLLRLIIAMITVPCKDGNARDYNSLRFPCNPCLRRYWTSTESYFILCVCVGTFLYPAWLKYVSTVATVPRLFSSRNSSASVAMKITKMKRALSFRNYFSFNSEHAWRSLQKRIVYARDSILR